MTRFGDTLLMLVAFGLALGHSAGYVSYDVAVVWILVYLLIVAVDIKKKIVKGQRDDT